MGRCLACKLLCNSEQSYCPSNINFNINVKRVLFVHVRRADSAAFRFLEVLFAPLAIHSCSYLSILHSILGTLPRREAGWQGDSRRFFDETTETAKEARCPVAQEPATRPNNQNSGQSPQRNPSPRTLRFIAHVCQRCAGLCASRRFDI